MEISHLLAFSLFELSENRCFLTLKKNFDRQISKSIIIEALNDGMSKAAVCRTFGVKRSTLIDTLKRVGWQELALAHVSDNQ